MIPVCASSSLAFHMMYSGAFLVAQGLKHLPAMWETWVRSLGQEDPLEKEMTIHSSTIVWKIPWTEESGKLQSMGSQRVGHSLETGQKQQTILKGKGQGRGRTIMGKKGLFRKDKWAFRRTDESYGSFGAFRVILVVKNPPAKEETCGFEMWF